MGRLFVEDTSAAATPFLPSAERIQVKVVIMLKRKVKGVTKSKDRCFMRPVKLSQEIFRAKPSKKKRITAANRLHFVLRTRQADTELRRLLFIDPLICMLT
jgi:hypothetical protein